MLGQPREFLGQARLSSLSPLIDHPDRQLRGSLVAAQLIGIAMLRHVVRADAVASRAMRNWCHALLRSSSRICASSKAGPLRARPPSRDSVVAVRSRPRHFANYCRSPSDRGYLPPLSSILSSIAMPLKYFQTPVPGRVGGSTLIVLAIRGDAATDQLEVAEIHDVSVALGDIPRTRHIAWCPRPTFVRGPSRRYLSAVSPLCTNGLAGTRDAPDALLSWSTLPTRGCPEATCVSADRGPGRQSGIATAASVGLWISRRPRRQPCE